MKRRLLGRRDVLGLSVVATAGLSSCGSSAATEGPSPNVGDYFPPNGSDAWETADPVAAGWSPTKLDAVVALVEAKASTSFMMLAGGRVLVEKYFQGASAASVRDVASVQKSVTSTLVGIARDRGLLGLDDAVSKFLPKGWSNASPAEEAPITLRHLMTHSSGIHPDTLKKVSNPGTAFVYNTAAYQKLRSVLEAAAAIDINALSKAWLFDAIGVTGSWKDRKIADATGAPIFGLVLGARDMARFGLLAQRGGVWAGKQVTRVGWFAEAWTPCAVKADYGLLWWLQGTGELKKVGAPKDVVSALGAKDQKIYVAPSLDLVVTRQGDAAGAASEAESDFDAMLWKAILEARA
jgi:CubicO group peptidase (beta-lactamase class C family)